MRESVTNVEIEDVLSSIRRLVSEEARSEAKRSLTSPDALILTPDTRVHDGRLATPEEAQGMPSKGAALSEAGQDAAFESPFDDDDKLDDVSPDSDASEGAAAQDADPVEADAEVDAESEVEDDADEAATVLDESAHVVPEFDPDLSAADVTESVEDAVEGTEGTEDTVADDADRIAALEVSAEEGGAGLEPADTHETTHETSDQSEDAASEDGAEGVVKEPALLLSPIFSSRMSTPKPDDESADGSFEEPARQGNEGFRPLQSRLSDLELAVNKSAEDWEPEHDASGQSHDNAPQTPPPSSHLEAVVVRDVFKPGDDEASADEAEALDTAKDHASSVSDEFSDQGTVTEAIEDTLDDAAEDAALEALSAEMDAHWRASPPPRLLGDVPPLTDEEELDHDYPDLDGSDAEADDATQTGNTPAAEAEPAQDDAELPVEAAESADGQTDGAGAGSEQDGSWTDVQSDDAEDPASSDVEELSDVEEPHAPETSAEDLEALAAEMTPDDVALPSSGLEDAEDEPEEADFARAASLFDPEMRGEVANSDTEVSTPTEAATSLGPSMAAVTQAVDEDVLRNMVAAIVREELQGDLGERITRNVRKLVRRELYRAMHTRDFD